jgi:hypothetical protein
MICYEPFSGKYLLKFFVMMLLAIPFIFSAYIQTLREQRLFLWGENNKRQQQTVLEIFEKQNEGIVLLEKPKSKEVRGKDVEEVLYNNKAFSEIFQTEQASIGIDMPVLKLKIEDGLDEQHALLDY